MQLFFIHIQIRKCTKKFNKVVLGLRGLSLSIRMQIMKLEGYLSIAWLSMDVHLVGIVPNLGKHLSKIELQPQSSRFPWKFVDNGCFHLLLPPPHKTLFPPLVSLYLMQALLIWGPIYIPPLLLFSWNLFFDN